MKRMTPATMKQIRTRELAQIHIAKKQLGWDDDVYKTAVLAASKGRTSSSGELDFRERFVLLNRMKASGFKVKPKTTTGKKSIELDDASTSKLIRHLWLKLHTIGAVRNPDENALRMYIKRQTGKDALQFLSNKQTTSVIESLKCWLEREEQKQPNKAAQ